MNTYYKAVRPDGTSFHDPNFRWLPEDGKIPDGGYLVEHPNSSSCMVDASEYLSVSVEPADCTGFRWPCRLLEVEAVGEVTSPESNFLPNKRAAKAWRVVRELDPRLALGPNADRVLAVIDRASRLTSEEARRMGAVGGRRTVRLRGRRTGRRRGCRTGRRRGRCRGSRRVRRRVRRRGRRMGRRMGRGAGRAGA